MSAWSLVAVLMSVASVITEGHTNAILPLRAMRVSIAILQPTTVLMSMVKMPLDIMLRSKVHAAAGGHVDVVYAVA